MKYVTVRVIDSNGRPQSDVRVSLLVYQTLASGMKTPQYTSSNGEANFDLDIDQFAEISVYVKGEERISRGSVKAEYRIIV
ncbi:MAG: hypothetical protein H7308_17780 [Chthonomonadaceae bacterium]|nr:hypothetical protein [Chthonomonadaceae bacterium]